MRIARAAGINGVEPGRKRVSAPLRCLFPALMLMILPLPAGADVYRYIDADGVIRFTDNYIEIPADQRPQVEIITRPEEIPPQEVKPETDREGATRPPGERGQSDRPGGDAGRAGSDPAGSQAQSRLQVEDLIRAKADLDKIYNELAAERAALEKERQTPKTAAGVREFQDKVNRFNQRLSEYERQRQAFQTRADQYNQRPAP